MYLKKFLGYETLETGVMMCTGMFLMLAIIVVIVNGPLFGKATRPPLMLVAIITFMTIIWIIAFFGALLSSKDVIKYVILMWSSLIICWLILTIMLVIFKNRISCIPYGSRCAPTFWILGTDITLRKPPPSTQTPEWPIDLPTTGNTDQPSDQPSNTTIGEGPTTLGAEPTQDTGNATTAATPNSNSSAATESKETAKPKQFLLTDSTVLSTVSQKVGPAAYFSTEKYIENSNVSDSAIQLAKTTLLRYLSMHNLQYPMPPDSPQEIPPDYPPDYPPTSPPSKKKKKPAKMWKENMAKSIPLLIFFTIVLFYSLYTLVSYYHQLNCIEECICTVECSKPCNSESQKTCNRRPPSRQC